MKELRLWQLTLLIAAILFFVDGARLPDTCSCATSCSHDIVSSYVIGTRYRYSYESEFASSLPGLTGEQSGLRLRCLVDVTAISACDFTLRLSDIRFSSLTGSTVIGYDSQIGSLAATDLRFSMQNGRIQSVCPSSNETKWALNMKRAILSTLQTSENPEIEELKTESDVSGSNCVTNYTINARSSASITISKTKDLTKCAQKHITHSLPHILQAIGEPLMALPFVRGMQQCTQTYQLEPTGAKINRTECTETHRFLTMTSKQQGPTLEVTNRLQFVESAPSRSREAVCGASRTTLKMEIDDPSRMSSSGAADRVRPTLRSICTLRSQNSSTFENILRLPVSFLELQTHLRMLRVEEYESIWADLPRLCSAPQATFIR
jgi:hypothetical protein